MALLACPVLVSVPRADAVVLRDVPVGFAPAATAWTSPSSGWVVGAAPCGSRSCPVLARTVDGGRSWWRTTVPELAVGVGEAARIAFVNPSVGVLTDGTRLHVTHDGGHTWQAAAVEGAVPPVRFGAVVAEPDRLYAVVVGSSQTRLHTASPDVARFTPAPGVRVPGAADGEVAVAGDGLHVVLAAVHRVNRHWVKVGHRWVSAAPPCPMGAATELAATGSSLFAWCSSDPGMGRMTKTLMVSQSGAAFRPLGEAPRAGITTGLAAVSPSTVAVTAVGRGATWLHLGRGHGTRWSSPLVLEGPPLHEPLFTNSGHGALVHGGPGWATARLLLTRDGGTTWLPVDFSSAAADLGAPDPGAGADDAIHLRSTTSYRGHQEAT